MSANRLRRLALTLCAGLTAAGEVGQKLRGDPWIGERFGWPQVVDPAQSSRGEDLFGLRAEFVQLARAADGARTINEGR